MNGIGFKNMKVFKEKQWFDFKDITLLTGANNSGKSSIINAMQMMQENISAKNIDELIRTEFVLKTNQTRYGTIANFVNNELSESENKYFTYIRKINNIEYHFKIDVIDKDAGLLRNYGIIKAIKAYDLISNELVFGIIIDSTYPKYQCKFKINFKYFIDKFNFKCKNSEILRKRIIELEKLKDGVNNGTSSIEDFRTFADFVSKEVSVYIYSGKTLTFSVNDKKESEKFHYSILENIDYYHDFFTNTIDEIGVFFTKNIEKNFKWSPSFISEIDYNKSFKKAYKNGIFDFSTLWKDNPEIENEFINLICSFYKKDFKESIKRLQNDYITLLSNSIWTMKERYPNDEEEVAVPENLTKTFISSLTDFGLTSTLLTTKETNENGEICFNSDQIIDANHVFDENSDAIINLRKTNFFEEIHYKLSEIFLKNYTTTKNKIHEKIIYAPVFEEIFSEILKKTVNINVGLINTNYVSSNRYLTKRLYNFNDNSDFTNLLNQVEKSRQKETIKKFINKWINEFGIGDELLLEPDTYSGNFRAFLKKGNTLVSLADFGLGTNQLLPIIFSLSIHIIYATPIENEIMPRTIVIEEPEANLHPAMQSKLADLFVDATNKFKVQIIAETHSEYLIRRLQFLVAKNYFNNGKEQISISNDKVNIYYINSEIDDERRKAYEINITKNGQLTESFGKGFFDETTNLQFELYKLNNVQFN